MLLEMKVIKNVRKKAFGRLLHKVLCAQYVSLSEKHERIPDLLSCIVLLRRCITTEYVSVFIESICQHSPEYYYGDKTPVSYLLLLDDFSKVYCCVPMGCNLLSCYLIPF